jgi:hypothetical protein
MAKVNQKPVSEADASWQAELRDRIQRHRRGGGAPLPLVVSSTVTAKAKKVSSTSTVGGGVGDQQPLPPLAALPVDGGGVNQQAAVGTPTGACSHLRRLARELQAMKDEFATRSLGALARLQFFNFFL